MGFRLEKPASLIKIPSPKVANFTALAIVAVFLSACVGTDSASVFDGVTSKQTAQAPQASQPALQNSIPADPQASQAAITPPTLPNSGAASANGFRSVPIGRKLPSPVASSNYLPNQSYLNQAALSSTAPNQTGTNPLTSNLTNTFKLQTTTDSNGATQELALRSLNDNSFEQNSLQLATLSPPVFDPDVIAPPVIDPIEAAAHSRIPPLYNSIIHGKCNAEWAPQPKRVEAKRINPGDPFYIEIRMRNTPLMPVGHTFIAYGNLDSNGEPTSERLAMLAPLGGYAGAGIAAAIPVPGVLTPYGDDCKIKAETAYRVSLSAQRYEKLLLAIKKAKEKKPVYMLFAQNCNHFMQRMADAVGIKAPKNKYVPAVKYLYDMIEVNEGIRIDTRNRSNIVKRGDRISPSSTKNKAI